MVTWTHTLVGRSGALKALWAIFELNAWDSENKRRKQEKEGGFMVQKEEKKQERT